MIEEMDLGELRNLSLFIGRSTDQSDCFLLLPGNRREMNVCNGSVHYSISDTKLIRRTK